jgi:hypothetical protein
MRTAAVGLHKKGSNKESRGKKRCGGEYKERATTVELKREEGSCEGGDDIAKAAPVQMEGK